MVSSNAQEIILDRTHSLSQTHIHQIFIDSPLYVFDSSFEDDRHAKRLLGE